MIDKKLYKDEIEHALKDHGVEFLKHEGYFGELFRQFHQKM